ncbi:chromosome segregation protein SMC [Halobacterium sp. KA-4]|uniref:archaea-specific SMC-related protein n=1 Tax=Halobacterium sp. KA-4 TaxID=2896367 RepID=UPI001E3F89B4|nr:archaea-specific SMC-related protein [Halobacterium sp. KA-4]MCD2200943.1 chromosome segregation protein SMC [Halobacterium sp. KA-4]
MWNLEIENIGGIRFGETSLSPGSNIVQASNFQGKSSLLAAIQTAMGTTGQFGEQHPLMERADEGHVTLETEDGTYKTTLERTVGVEEDTITRSGDTYLTDEQDQVAARLFACLGENNPVRAAVREKDQEKLTELLTKPLETENIDLRIKNLQSEIADINDDLKQADRAMDKLPAAQEDVTQLEKELEELKEQRDELEEKVDEDTEQRDLRNELTSKQSDLDRKKSQLERLEKQIGRRENQLEQKQEELEELEVPEELDLDTNVNEKQERVKELELKINLLGDLYRSNKAVLDENELALITDVERNISGDTFDCFVCGQDTSEEDVQEQLEAIKQKQQSLEEQKAELDQEISKIQQRKREIRSNRQKKEELETDIKQLKVDIQEDEQEVEGVKSDIEALEDEVEELDAKYEEAEEEEEEFSSELKTVQQKIGTTENKLSRAKDKLERLDEEASGRDEIQAKLDEKKNELKELRQRRNKKYSELVDQFDEAMDEIMNTFAPGFDGARLDKTMDTNKTIDKFEIVVAREVDGKGRNTDLSNLSEGERELVGIVTALAGYRTFNVSERVPCILLDGIGQLAAEHIRHMIDYLEDTTEILVTTAYPEAGSFDGRTISPDNWEVISSEGPVTP